jgi:diguanylate cyclase (GGDEF)-like protein
MSILGRRSIRKTLQLVLLISSCSALLLATVGFAVNDWFTSRDQMVERMRSQAAIIGNTSVAALMFGDQQSASKTLSALASERDVVGAVLYTPNGLSFASYRRDTDTLTPTTLMSFNAGSIDGQLFIQTPVRHDGEIIGSIQLIADNSQWRQQQLLRLGTVFGLFVVSLLVAFIFSQRLQRVVTDPVLRLAETARQITRRRDYSLRAEKLSRDEIGYLVDDFNEMLNQIQVQDAELQRVQGQLEDKVKLRTAELAELASKYEHQAYHDALTGLANRITFEYRLKDTIGHVNRHGGELEVLFFDLDRFKRINDTLGHSIGDKLLVQLSKRLMSCLRTNDTLARLGGDEFGVLMTNTTLARAGEVAQKLIDVINEPVDVEGHKLHVSTSIGISTYPGDGDSAEAIVKNADTAMYRSKDKGGNQFTFYASDMNQRVERRLRLENKMRAAIDSSAFYLHYQPKWDTQTKQLVGAEALVRWHDAEEGNISPVEFIPLAEECGLIHDIDLWVLEQACIDFGGLYSRGYADIQLSVNFSPSHFVRYDICDEVSRILKRTGFSGDCLELEIIENLIGPDVEDIYSKVHAIRGLGVEISIDDFGTAYSSLSRLKQLPLNTLKIDKSFIMDLDNDPDDKTLVKTIITMAHNLNLKVVAEGVETESQYEFVKQHQCDIVQGYLLGKPMPLDELESLARKANTVN